MTTITAAVDWRTQAACATADPDLFFPDTTTPASMVQQAKQICATCPVMRTCLEDAMRRREPEGICGGLTAQERQQLLNPGPVAVPGGRRPGKTQARQVAVKHGAYVMVALVEWRMSVAQVAAALNSTPVAVYRAYRMLVPPLNGKVRSGNPSLIEKLVCTSKERLQSLERRGWSHTEIGAELEVAQSFVSAAFAVLRQREEGIRRLSRNGATDAVQRLQGEEMRILLESGVGVGVQDAIQLAGESILRMHHDEGMTLRQVAAELGLCREVVRKAYLEMTATPVVRSLKQNEMEEAA